ncbi:MAG: C40 family peptidase [Bacteroidales bacterium]|nr:C40 family peptidase [Bacteroidales bacterium]
MKYGIAKISIIPIRKESAEQSEMVSQLLFGDLFTISYENEKWCKIQTQYDEYVGWIDRKMCHYLSEDNYNMLVKAKKSHVISTSASLIRQSDGININVVAGSCFFDYDKKSNSFKIEEESYVFSGKIAKKPEDINISIVETAKSFLETPYLWGGKNPFGIDCSGLTQIVYKINGVFLPRDASKQVELGRTLNFLNEAKPGDLAFFDNDEGIITHVGILLGSNKIIHASGIVRIDVIDHQGIFNLSTKRYSHKLRLLKSIV